MFLGLWEWRFFVTARAAGSTDLSGVREDIYFPTHDGLGLKLRHGHLFEAKQRLDILRVHGHDIELWHKTLLPPQCVDGMLLRRDLTAQALGVDEFVSSGRVHCRKAKSYVNGVELVDLEFLAFRDGDDAPCLVERYSSICVEGGSPESIAARAPTDLPPGSIVCGFPAMVAAIARRTSLSSGV